MTKEEGIAFAEWVADTIFDDNWEYNKEAFAEIACRKLSKLGIVARMGDEWVLVDNEETLEQEPVLDKIRAEIAEYGSIMVSYAITKDTKTDKGIEKLVNGVLKQAKEQVLEIIDKYRNEVNHEADN